MIKLILLSAAISLTQLAVAEVTNAPNKQAMDMAAINKAHAEAKKADKDAPFWTEDQTREAELEIKFKKAIVDNPDEKKNYAYLAGLYISNNKTAKAIDAYQDAITYDPENAKLFAGLSIAYLHHAKYSMAQAMAAEAQRLDPNLKGVAKIEEYVVAKQEAIEAASKVSSDDQKIDMSKGVGLHGSVMPTATGAKPSDKIHNPN